MFSTGNTGHESGSDIEHSGELTSTGLDRVSSPKLVSAPELSAGSTLEVGSAEDELSMLVTDVGLGSIVGTTVVAVVAVVETAVVVAAVVELQLPTVAAQGAKPPSSAHALALMTEAIRTSACHDEARPRVLGHFGRNVRASIARTIGL